MCLGGFINYGFGLQFGLGGSLGGHAACHAMIVELS